MISRRRFLAGGASVLAAPLAAVAQPAAKAHRVGVLTPGPQQWEPEAFREGLRELGFTEGVNLILDVRSADGQLDRLPSLATELVKSRPDVIVAVNTPGSRAAIGATRTIPIVAFAGDPVGSGLVSSLAHPGGNVTGISNFSGELAGKRLSLLKEAVPGATRVAVLLNPDDPITAPQVRDTKSAAGRLGVQTTFLAVRKADDLERAFATLVEWRAQAILRLAGQAQLVSRPTIELALRHRLPTMMVLKSEVRAGALMSYFPDHVEIFRRIAQYVDKILKGAKPAELPIEEPTKFELVINLKTAKALGLTIPPSLLLRADEVIQ